MTTPRLPAELERFGRQLAALQARILQLERGANATQLDSASIENGALTINDADGNPVIVLGLQDDGSYAHNAVGQAVPEVPSTPAVAAGIQGVQVSWDGYMADGSSPAADLAGVQVHCSDDPAFIPGPASLQSTMIAPGTRPVVGLQAYVVYYICFVAVNEAGSTSPPTPLVSVAPQAVADNIGAGEITAAMVDFSIATGGINVTIGATAPSSPNVGDLFFDSANGYQMDQWNGTAWVTFQFGTGAIAANSVTADLIAAQAITAGLIAAGAIDGQVINGITINGSTISAADMQVSGVNGGLFIYSSGGTIVQTFQAGGAPWVCPAGVFTIYAEGWGSAGGGAFGGGLSGGTGGSSAEYAAEPALAVTPGNSYPWTWSPGGTGGASSGSPAGGNGGDLIFAGDTATLHAHGGFGASGIGPPGAAGTGSTNTVHNDGALGKRDPAIGGGVAQDGGGGASSGGPGGPGLPGNGNYGAAAVPGGSGAGGNGFGGGTDGLSGMPGSVPGGGGGGGSNQSGGSNRGAAGGGAQLRLTFTTTTPALIASFCGAPTTDPSGLFSVPAGPYMLGVPVSFQGSSGEFAHGTVSAPSSRSLQLAPPKVVTSDVPAALLMTGAPSGGVPQLSFAGLAVPVLCGFRPSGGIFASVASSTTLVMDGLCFVTLPANTIWAFECLAIYSGGVGTSNFRFTVLSPGGTEADWYVPVYQNTSGTNIFNETSAASAVKIAQTNAVATQLGLTIHGTLYLGGSGGACGLGWAQGTSSTTTTRLWSGSRFAAWQIG